MEILTYPVGVLVGLLPVAVDLGPRAQPARLLLDGLPACELSPSKRECTVDLGAQPRVHLLELVRSGPDGEITEKVTRWVNMPGVTEAEAYVHVACDAASSCTLTPSFAHPEQRAVSRLILAVDGAEIFRGPPAQLPRPITIRHPAAAQAVLVSLEAEFSDGRRAAFATVVGAQLSEESGTSLQPVPIAMGAPALSPRELAEALAAAAGVRVRSVEKGQSELSFVVEPSALATASKLWRDLKVLAAASGANSPPSLTLPAGTTAPTLFAGSGAGAHVVNELEPLDRLRILAANEGLADFDAFGFAAGKRGWLRALVEGTPQLTGKGLRTAEAVAAAAYANGAGWRRRAVVLIVGTPPPVGGAVVEKDASRFSAEAVRAYLREIMVPLIVWRVGEVPREEWGSEKLLRSGRDFTRAVAEVRGELDRQQIAWIEGRRHPASLDPRLPGGTRLAGR